MKELNSLLCIKKINFMKKYSVAIVDDHLLLSQAIGGIVASFKQFEVAYLCKNGSELVEKINQNNIPHLVLMDVNMPIMNGIETTQWLSKHHPQINVLALTVEEDENTILKMIRSGAKGYLLKDTDKNTLEEALIKIMETGFYHSNAVSDALMQSMTQKTVTKYDLKETEIEFLKWVCTEYTYKEIAEFMALSPKTIDGYREHLFEKLNVKNRIGLVIYAIKNNIYTI